MKVKDLQWIKKNIKFKDADNIQFTIEISFSNRNGFKELSLSGTSGGSCGQLQDSIKPSNDAQEKLIKLWNKYHLNGMNAGTPEQQEVIKTRNFPLNSNKVDYDRACRLLGDWIPWCDKRNKMAVKHPETGKSYIYGRAWYHLPLPEDIEQQIEEIIEEIKGIEDDKRGDELIIDPNEQEDENYLNDCDDRIIALALYLELTMNEIDEIEDNNDESRYSYCGTDYLVDDYDTLKEIAKDYLEQDDYLWKQAVEAGNTEEGLSDWCETVVDTDGVGHILNSYDGNSYEQSVNNTTYTIVQN